MNCPTAMRHYIQSLKPENLVPLLRESGDAFRATVGRVTPAKAAHRYAPGKWAVVEVLQHMVDSERIFSYRALRIARQDPGVLSSFDENVVAEAARAGSRSAPSLAAEFEALRKANLIFFETLNPDRLGAEAPFADGRVSVDALGLLMSGHLTHHLGVLRDRYGV